MSGIYIHIPFCKKACHYCDFHFSVSLKNKKAFVDALLTEITNSQLPAKNDMINTIYFGGGTPSILSINELSEIIQKLQTTFLISPQVEITLEANPDDLSEEKTTGLKQIGINRLSIGTQTYQDNLLTSLNRSHNYIQAIDCIKHARKVGFENINIDLIFGLPQSTMASFKQDVKILLAQNPEHISAYWLTIEEKTVFGKWQKKGLLSPLPDDNALEQWAHLKETLKRAGYIQYEISNFSKPKLESKHNSNY